MYSKHFSNPKPGYPTGAAERGAGHRGAGHRGAGHRGAEHRGAGQGWGGAVRPRHDFSFFDTQSTEDDHPGRLFGSMGKRNPM